MEGRWVVYVCIIVCVPRARVSMTTRERASERAGVSMYACMPLSTCVCVGGGGCVCACVCVCGVCMCVWCVCV